MGLKICHTVCGILCYQANLGGKISDALIQRRLMSERNFVNFSTTIPGIQFYFKHTIYDLQRQNNELSVTEWKVQRNGKNGKRNQFTVSENWAKDLIKHMLKNEIAHDIFVNGKLTYRKVDPEEMETIATSEEENFPSAADDPENAGEGPADEDQMQKSESNSKPDDAPLPQKELRENIGFGFVNFIARILGFTVPNSTPR
jgi:hypothetical protein